MELRSRKTSLKQQPSYLSSKSKSADSGTETGHSSSTSAPGVGENTHFTNLLYRPRRPSRPDNYTDSDFLDSLLLNPNKQQWSIFDSALKSSRVALQVCSSAIFLIAFCHLSSGVLRPTVLLALSSGSTILGYIIYQLYSFWPLDKGLVHFMYNLQKEHVRVTVLYLIFSYQLAPVLRTLMDTISTDTIYVCSALMLLVHLFSSDYGLSNGFLVSRTISVNCAVIGSICLTSRMSSNEQSFALLTLAVQTFLLFPIFSKCLWDSTLGLFIMILTTAIGSMSVSTNFFLYFTIVIFFIIMVLPMIFIVSLKFKYNIYGPWDEAIVKNINPENVKRDF